jgi:WD40 repeat protein
VSVHPGGRLLAVGTIFGVSLFDLPTGVELGRVGPGASLFTHFDPSSGDLLTYSGPGLFRWPVRVDPGPPETVVVGPARRVAEGSNKLDEAFDVSQDGKVVAVARRTQATVYLPADAAAEGPGAPEPPPADGLQTVALGPLTDARSMCVSPDGCWVLTTTHGTPDGQLWDVRTRRLVRTVRDLRLFTPDGRWLTNGRRRLAVGTWDEAPPLDVPDGPQALAFSPDGALFAGQSGDEAVDLVDAATGKTLVQLGLPEQSRTGFATFSPDGTQLVLQSGDYHVVYVWDLRALRRHLADLSLDWDAPPYPPAPADDRRGPPAFVLK